MAQVAADADAYTNGRVGIFFPGVDPTLDGQCVSLVKWFMAEMSSVPNPQAARGDARYVGKTLVAQGHAIEFPYDQRIRGDIVCYEYGQYGHTGVILSGNRTFEENVNWPGVASKIVDGSRVFASRIGSMSESWRHDMHIYRLKTYREAGSPQGEPMFTTGDANNLVPVLFGTSPDAADRALDGQTFHDAVYNLAAKYGDGNHLHFKQGILVPGDIDNFLGVFGIKADDQDHQFASLGWHDGMYAMYARHGAEMAKASTNDSLAAKKLAEIKKIVES